VSRAEEMAALLEALVAVDTENPPGRRLGECAALLHDAMGTLGLAPELIRLAPSGQLEEPCIVRGSYGEGPRTVYFHGHFDVVPAQRREQFRARRADGRIVGRGSADMKGGLVSMLHGAAAAGQLDGRIVLHLVCDEETGGAAGSAHLRDAGLIDPHALAMATAEPTGGAVWHESRGALTMRVEVRGREAHVGQAHLGVNAFEGMIDLAAPLAALARELRERGTTAVVGGAAGSGSNFNVVPGSAWFSVDCRVEPEEDLDAVAARILATIERSAAQAGADVAVDVLQRAPPARTARTDPAAVALARAVEEVEGAPPRFERCPGALDTRWYAQLGIPAFAYGAGRLDVSHGPDEYIDEAAMGRCADVYSRFAGALLRTS